MKRDCENVSREGARWVKAVLSMYVKDMINDGDYGRLERELLDIIRAERAIARRCRGYVSSGAASIPAPAQEQK